MRRTPIVLLLMLLAASCAPAEEELVGEGETPAPAGTLTLELEMPDTLGEGGYVLFTLHLTNEGDQPVEIVMPSGQEGDIVLERGGEEVYRWSEDRVFTMALQEFVLGPGQTRTSELEEESLDVPAGDYELTANSTAEPGPAPVRRSVTVR